MKEVEIFDHNISENGFIPKSLLSTILYINYVNERHDKLVVDKHYNSM